MLAECTFAARVRADSPGNLITFTLLVHLSHPSMLALVLFYRVSCIGPCVGYIHSFAFTPHCDYTIIWYQYAVGGANSSHRARRHFAYNYTISS